LVQKTIYLFIYSFIDCPSRPLGGYAAINYEYMCFLSLTERVVHSSTSALDGGFVERVRYSSLIGDACQLADTLILIALKFVLYL
jgi:hypothetical protein